MPLLHVYVQYSAVCDVNACQLNAYRNDDNLISVCVSNRHVQYLKYSAQHHSLIDCIRFKITRYEASYLSAVDPDVLQPHVIFLSSLQLLLFFFSLMLLTYVFFSLSLFLLLLSLDSLPNHNYQYHVQYLNK